MQKDNRFFDDLSKLASGAAGSVMDIVREVEAQVMGKIDQLLAKRNLVAREEFEVLRDMVAKQRIEQESLKEKIAALESQLRAK